MDKDSAQLLAELGISPVPDDPIVDSEWKPVATAKIAGVQAHSITAVVTNNGYLTEVWRNDWHLDPQGAGQVFQRVMNANSVSAWHVHLRTTDRLFCGAWCSSMPAAAHRPTWLLQSTVLVNTARWSFRFHQAWSMGSKHSAVTRQRLSIRSITHTVTSSPTTTAFPKILSKCHTNSNEHRQRMRATRRRRDCHLSPAAAVAFGGTIGDQSDLH